VNQRGFHRLNPDFNAALTQLLDQFEDRQHAVDFYRVVTGHGYKDTGFHML